MRLIVVMIALLGCAKERRVSARESLEKHVELRDEMCRCAKGDGACALKVMDAREQFLRLEGDDSFQVERVALAKRFQQVVEGYSNCMMIANTR